MARGINRLSAAKISKLKKPGRYADGGGLWLQVSASSSKGGGVTKSWTFRFMLDKRARHMGLGSLRTLSPAKARKKAQEARELLLEGLLDEWGRQVGASRQPPVRRYYVSGADSNTLPHRIAVAAAAHDIPWVLTQEAAAQRYAPFLTAITRVACRTPPGRATELVLRDLKARQVDEGTNLTIIETPSEGEFLFKERRDDVWLASPVQVYLDLLWGEGRAKDIAKHLREERIGF
jgi:hypothetical protein